MPQQASWGHFCGCPIHRKVSSSPQGFEPLHPPIEGLLFQDHSFLCTTFTLDEVYISPRLLNSKVAVLPFFRARL